MFSAAKKTGSTAGVWFDWTKAERRVGIDDFYIYDREFGPGFIKICTYFPYPIKVWLNGHEWAKRQADDAGIGCSALANGFASWTTRQGSKASATGFRPATWKGSSTTGWPCSRRRSPMSTVPAATGGNFPCARSK